ncbi:Release factor glutamine methyltransferase [Frondihabitans sp. 762G35]|uniref:peptide chain release factor N(5)-glutamine methyltransferase n=1 Tax=Frondihabitans sp. 762G35 TaxID=1446794 RepID=UPI000D20AF5B|nr:peptide chain release factor N(5)-glutamine methyltransferase [Frondihabitans sp. 762G35]ARC57198.1 Release factor glutamine methyltransferase [Frondihabitans sp. 762G35]
MTPAATTIASALGSARSVLSEAGIPQPDVDAALLLGHVLGLSRGEVATKEVIGTALDRADAARFDDLVSRRATREPLQHITGLAPFRSLELHVGPGVFVPRPETEGVAQIAIDALRAAPQESPIAVDLGTGSGALALALATEVPHAHVFAVELSPEAAVWTARNIASTGARVDLVVGDLADALPELDGSVSVVVSNPPYIPVGMVPRDPEVRLFDPDLALFGGADGLDVVRSLSARALRLLQPGGTLVIEHGEEQGAAIRDLLTRDGWRLAATHLDLTRRDRATTAVR